MATASVQLALVSTAQSVKTTDLCRVAAALQKQMTYDFGPAWGAAVAVGAFDLDSIPNDYAVIIVRDSIPGNGLNGYHRDKFGSPVAAIRYWEHWSITASHECMELVLNPALDQFREGPAPDGDGSVEYLLEVCDPCQGPVHAYTIDGVAVSDFCMPRWFDAAARDGPYTFNRSVDAPFRIASDGYAMWRRAGGGATLHQTFWMGEELKTSTVDNATLGAVGRGSLYGDAIAQVQRRPLDEATIDRLRIACDKAAAQALQRKDLVLEALHLADRS